MYIDYLQVTEIFTTGIAGSGNRGLLLRKPGFQNRVATGCEIGRGNLATDKLLKSLHKADSGNGSSGKGDFATQKVLK